MQAHHRQSYYAVLGVQPGATAAEIRAAYHRLAMRWHPDKIASGGGAGADPARAEEAKSRFQQIHEAYQVLSDDKRRALYDAGMYDPLDDDDDQEDVEGFHDFVQEMVSLMAREEPVYSLAELQSMLDGMIKDFTAPQPWPSGFFYTGGGGGGGGGASSPSPLGKPSSQEQSTASSRLHPYGFGDAPCFSRTAFSQ